MRASSRPWSRLSGRLSSRLSTRLPIGLTSRLRPKALPLRWRLVAAAVAASAAFAVLFGLAAAWRLDQLEDSAVTSALRSQLDLVRPELSAAGTLGSPGNQVPKSTLAQVVGPNGTVRDASPALAGIRPLVGVRQVRRAGPDGLRASVGLERPDLDVALLAVPITVRTAGGHAGHGALVVGIDSEGFLAARTQLIGLLEIGLPIVVVVIGVLTWLLSGRALRTVARLTEEAEAVSVSDIGRGLAVPRHDAELARLVAALNRMLDRIGNSLARQRAFSAEASHRLRTPLALLRAEAELALATGSPREMRAALRQVLVDADHLSQLVDRLLATAADPALHADTVAVAEAVGAVSGRWQRLAGTAGVELVVDVVVMARVDQSLLHGGVDPLVENAVQHTPAGGRVEVRVESAPHHLVAVTVTNTGIGVEPSIVDRVFEPRVSTRTEQGGAGLGLWLAREALRAAGGDVTLVDPRPGVTCFRACVPAQSAGSSRLAAPLTAGPAPASALPATSGLPADDDEPAPLPETAERHSV